MTPTNYSQADLKSLARELIAKVLTTLAAKGRTRSQIRFRAWWLRVTNSHTILVLPYSELSDGAWVDLESTTVL